MHATFERKVTAWAARAGIEYLNDVTPEMVREFAKELKALFLLQRWVGLRIGDATMLRRSALVGGRLLVAFFGEIMKSGRIRSTLERPVLFACPVDATGVLNGTDKY